MATPSIVSDLAAFATPWMNRAVTWISAFLMLQSPTFFREFHFEHHRRTSDPHGDPEISGAPGLLGVWPANPLFYFVVASGQHLMFGKAAFTIRGVITTEPGRRLAPIMSMLKCATICDNGTGGE